MIKERKKKDRFDIHDFEMSWLACTLFRKGISGNSERPRIKKVGGGGGYEYSSSHVFFFLTFLFPL